MRFLPTICLIFLAIPLFSQRITVSGKVIDRETKEPLVFATIEIKGKTISTISNLQGEFDFHIPAEYRNEILVISILGYSSFESPVWAVLSPTPIMFELAIATTLLDEIIVSDSLSGGDILLIAINRITKNYPMKPFLMEGFYRDVKKVGGTYISILEAAVKIYDEEYNEPRNKIKLRERVKLMEVRRSVGYESKFTDFFDQVNLLEDILLKNNVRYRQFLPNDGKYYKVNRDKDSFYNGHEVFVINHTKYFSLKIFIDKGDYSIIHLEIDKSAQPSDDNTIDKKRNMISRHQGVKKIIDFKRIDGKMFLNYMTVTSRINWYDVNSNALLFETELLQQLLINEVTPNTNERIGPTEKMRNYGLQYQDLRYNKEFWDNYNVIKETPLDKKILEDLEKAGPLNKQFEGKY